MAVGFRVGAAQTFTEAWNGKVWSVVPSPNGGLVYDQLSSVSCPSTTLCKAIGTTTGSFGGLGHSYIESWNRRKWSLSTSPTTAGKDASYLNGVSCAANTSCQAVGTVIETYG